MLLEPLEDPGYSQVKKGYYSLPMHLISCAFKGAFFALPDTVLEYCMFLERDP